MNIRLVLSALVSFVFYFTWAYWANYSDDIARAVTLKSALVQGTYSAVVTLFFTAVLERLVFKYKNNVISLMFITPIICKFHAKSPQNLAIKQSFNNAIDRCANFTDHKKIPATLFAPIIPLAVQTVLVISVNIINQTPNLALTVAPSILFTALYAYSYMFVLLKKWS
ncbi:hypothetical protein [Marinicellulosiphila megalodicopiae]|uniref:hypothetical protein n=1 Tax=Marinicellulosiphila megalodicopiae TaxID=2724896 RepID=UPI003BAFAF68